MINQLQKGKLDPIKFFELVGLMKKIPRTGWINHGLINVESIAEHSYRTAVIAYILSLDLKCNSEKLIKMAMVHDMSEIITGDIVFEHGLLVDPKKQLKKEEMEKEALQRLSLITPSGNEMFKLWQEYNEQKTAEAQLLKQIDKLEMAIQALEYENPKKPKSSEGVLGEHKKNTSIIHCC